MPRSYWMTPRRRRICRPLARGSKTAFARKCLRDPSFRNAFTKGMGVSQRHEIARLNSDDVTSILRNKSSKVLNQFTWESLINEVKSVAPTLFHLLQSCTKTRKTRKNHDAIIGVLVSIICRHRRPAASLFQRLISLILYSGHASKRVQCDIIVMLHVSICV